MSGVSNTEGEGAIPAAGVAEPAESTASGTDTAEISQADLDALLGAANAVDTRLDSTGRPFDEVAAAMQAAIEEERASTPAPAPFAVSTRPFEFPELGGASAAGIDARRVTLLSDVNLGVKIELGRTRMLVEDVLKLGEGSVVELDKLAGDPVDVFANDRLIAKGEVLVLNDTFCVRITEVFSRDPHRVNV
jgi:flagellar motor switch protein FliN/FliY